VVKTVLNKALCGSPVLVILNVKSTSELYKGHSLVNSGILVCVLLTPLFSIEHELFNQWIVVLMFLKREVTVNERTVHKIGKTL
jgi:hypothetical protein